MAHLYIATRGIINDVERFITHMRAQYFPYKYKGKDCYAQLGMRPIQLWEVVVPEDAIPQLCKSLWGTNPTPRAEWKYKWQLGMLRNALGAKKIPKFDEKLQSKIIYRQNVGIYPIGIKEDNHMEDGTEIL